MDKINTVIINQPHGAGDYLFAMSIANRFADEGYKVLWPVMNIYAPLAKHFPKVTMIDKALIGIDYTRRDSYEFNGCRVIPLRFADSIMQVPYTQCMSSKYMLLDMDWTKWKENCIIERDYASEMKLYHEELGLSTDEEYNLISENFTTGGARHVGITPPDNGLRNIYMRFIDGYSLIDWVKIMEQATTLHLVASSNIYLTELFPMKAKVNLYVRRPNEQNHSNYDYILTKDNYILHP